MAHAGAAGAAGTAGHCGRRGDGAMGTRLGRTQLTAAASSARRRRARVTGFLVAEPVNNVAPDAAQLSDAYSHFSVPSEPMAAYVLTDACELLGTRPAR